MSSRSFDIAVFNQSCSRQIFGFCHEVANELGPTLLYTGTALSAPTTPELTLASGPAYDNTSYKTRLRTWASYSLAAYGVGRRLTGHPTLVVTSNPPFGPFLAYALKKQRGFRYVIRVLDVYPDAIVQSGLARGPLGLVPPAWEGLSRLAFGEADSVITLGECMADRVRRFLRPGQSVHVIPDWVDTEQVAPVPAGENWFRHEHNPEGKLVVLYSGNLGVTHDAEGLFQAIERLESDPRILFLFVGGGARRAEVLERTRGRRNCKVLPSQPEETLSYSLGSADVAVVLLGDSGNGVSMPSKSYYMMAAGAAILGLSAGENDLARTIALHELGCNVAPRDVDGIVEALIRLATYPSLLVRARENARRAAVAHFSRHICSARLLEVLREVHTRRS